MGTKHWTIEEELKLKELYEQDGLGVEEISLIIGRPIEGINIKRKRLKLIHTKEQTKNLKSRNTIGHKNYMFGKKGANAGLTKETCERIKKAGEKISIKRKEGFQSGKIKKLIGLENPLFGRTPWSKGKKKEDDIRLKNAAKINSDKAKERWKNLSEEEKEKRRVLWASQAKKKRYLRSSIEISVEKILSDMNLDFIPSYRMGRFLLDFWVPSKKLCIECNGDYWHCNPNKYSFSDKYQKKNMERDERKKNMLLSSGFNLLVLWEEDIKLDKARELIERFLNGC